MENINVNDLIRNILNRANSIIDCLPCYLQDNIREAINFIKKFSFEYGFKYDNDNDIDNFIYHVKFSAENLYMCLNNISRDLGICNLLFPRNVYLEDAAYNIIAIISFMNQYNYELDLNFNVSKRKIK